MQQKKVCQNCFEEPATHNGLCKDCYDTITAPPVLTDEELDRILSEDGEALHQEGEHVRVLETQKGLTVVMPTIRRHTESGPVPMDVLDILRATTSNVIKLRKTYLSLSHLR